MQIYVATHTMLYTISIERFSVWPFVGRFLPKLQPRDALAVFSFSQTTRLFSRNGGLQSLRVNLRQPRHEILHLLP